MTGFREVQQNGVTCSGHAVFFFPIQLYFSTSFTIVSRL